MGAIGRCLIFKRSASTSPTRRWARRMTSSPDRDRAIGPLPPALSSMWRLCKLGYRHEPRLTVAAFGLSQLAALPDALLALWLMLLGQGRLAHRPGMAVGRALGRAIAAPAPC